MYRYSGADARSGVANKNEAEDLRSAPVQVPRATAQDPISIRPLLSQSSPLRPSQWVRAAEVVPLTKIRQRGLLDRARMIRSRRKKEWLVIQWVGGHGRRGRRRAAFGLILVRTRTESWHTRRSAHSLRAHGRRRRAHGRGTRLFDASRQHDKRAQCL